MISSKIPPPKTTAINFGLGFNDELGIKVKGDVFGVLQYEDGREEVVLDKSNVYTLDGGILAAVLFSKNLGAGFPRGIDMLAVGTGASGSSASPDIADYRQRSLNVPLFRKTFTSVVYRKPNGDLSVDNNNDPIPTNIVDFTTTFESADAVGALTEMGLMCTFSETGNNLADFDPSGDVFPQRSTELDITSHDILVNYLTFPVINKPSGAILAITWRLTF